MSVVRSSCSKAWRALVLSCTLVQSLRGMGVALWWDLRMRMYGAVRQIALGLNLK